MNEIVTPDKILALQEIIATMPQVELDTSHFFADGMYARKVFRHAGVCIVGRVHKREHFFIVLDGWLAVVQGGVAKEYGPGSVIVSAPGTKRVTFALTDCVAMTVHRTDKTNLSEIEAELIADDAGTVLYDAANKLKNSQLEAL